ncbi:MAG: hypothetical protein R3336_00945, partial [Phycisphaeraceae bacterium]|nr:hypothetical protein [Phycisphaeraceae bacterium]
PALAESDLDGFGEALYRLQQTVGSCFKAAQGGIYADEQLAEIVAWCRREGVRGVGQSSWGPTLYAVVGSESEAEGLADRLAKQFDLNAGEEVWVTRADNQGARITATGRSQPADRGPESPSAEVAS